MKYYLILNQSYYTKRDFEIAKVPKIGEKEFKDSLCDFPNICLKITQKQYNYLTKQMIPIIEKEM